MRFLWFVPLAALACAHAGSHFYPASPAEAVAGHPEAAVAEAAGVRLTVHAGDWRGAPEDLEDRLTPVEVYVENEGRTAIRIGSEQFSLRAPNGFRYQALDAREVQSQFSQASRGTVVYYGLYGAYPWPGFWRPYRHHFYPYMGFGWYGPPALAYAVPAPEAQPPPPAPRGTLDPGGQVSVLLFFPVPASSLPAIEVSMNVVDAGGAQLGVVRVPLTRDRVAAPPSGAPPPPPGTPPPNPPPPPTSPPAPPRS